MHGQGVAEEVEEGILEHAAVAVAVGAMSEDVSWNLGDGGDTHERTKRSRLSQLGFLGLNLMKFFQRTWATGAMPLVGGQSRGQ